MTIMEFADCIERYGVDFARWPDELTEAALDLLSGSDRAQMIYTHLTAFEEEWLGRPGETAVLAQKILRAIGDEA